VKFDKASVNIFTTLSLSNHPENQDIYIYMYTYLYSYITRWDICSKIHLLWLYTPY